MSNYTDVADGVIEAIAEAGEPLTIKRTTVVKDPNAPSQPGTATTDTYTCQGYVGPISQWNPTSMQREVTTDCYIDPLSVLDSDGLPVNTTDALGFITAEGDVVSDAGGKQWVMTQERHPRIEGRIALFWHSGLA